MPFKLTALKYGFLLYSAENNLKKTISMKIFPNKKPTVSDWLFRVIKKLYFNKGLPNPASATGCDAGIGQF
jgi:hypothetical protein